MDTTVIDCLVTQASRFKMFSFLTRGSALGLPQKLKLPIFNEKCVLQLSPLKKSIGRGKISFERYARADDRNKFA